MPKLKTRKVISKRLKVTATGKFLKKTAGQDHFNSREPGKVSRNKRRYQLVTDSDKRLVSSFIPYSR